MYFHLLFEKKRGSIPQCQNLLGRCQDNGEWRTRLLTKLRESKRKQTVKRKGEKSSISSRGRMVLAENTLLDPVAPAPSLIPCLFLRTTGALCPSRSQEHPNWRLFVPGKVGFFLAKTDIPDCYFESVTVWLAWLLEARLGN